jgi:dTDP-4-dehydrorhamnose reductase
MKFAVLGAAGQLGYELCQRLPGTVVPLTRAEADLAQPATVREKLENCHPDVVVNCAAYNFVDRAESEPTAAMAVNGWGAKALAEICRDLACVLVHFSTDYIFGLQSDRSTPYVAGDAPGPISTYGLSKLAGEYLVRATAPRHFVIRTCGLYGPRGVGGKGGNFVETMLRLAAGGQTPRVVADQYCTPTYAVDLAEAAAKLVVTDRYGLHHMTNAGSCSWFEFAKTIFELASVEAKVVPIPSSEWKAAARRPAYSVLECQAPLRPWREALTAYLASRGR